MPRPISRTVPTLLTALTLLWLGTASAAPEASQPPPVRTLCVVDAAGPTGDTVERMYDFAVDAADLGALFRLTAHADTAAARAALEAGRCDAALLTAPGAEASLQMRADRFPAGFAESARALLADHTRPATGGPMLSLRQPR